MKEDLNMKRRALALVLASVITVSLVGCGNSSGGNSGNNAANNAAESTSTEAEAETETDAEVEESTSSGQEAVTLNVTTTYAGEDTNAKNFQDAYKEWEEATGNKVEDGSATSDEAFKARIATDFETGSEPDVLFYFNGVDSNTFVEQDKVVSIDEIRAEYPDYASNMKDDMLGASPVDGKNYSIPVNGYWEGLFVNKEVLEAAGVEVPSASTTYDQFLEMCQAIKDAGYTPIAVSLQEVPHYWFEFAIYNHQNVATHNTVPGAVDDEYGKAWSAGLADIKDLYEKGFLPENTLTATDAETVQLFTSDKAAFLIDGSWKVGGIEEAVDDIENYAVTYVPGMGERKSTDTIGGLSMGYFITRKAWDDPEKRDAAVSFVEHMTSDEVVSKFAGTSVTALKNGATLDESTLSALGQSALAFSAGVTGVAPAVQDNLSNDVRVPIFGEMAAIVNGDKTTDDAVQQVLDLLNE